jgi:hypothetical protein
MRRAALLLVGVAACGRGGEAPAAPSASRLDIELAIINAESSKDSHEQTESFRLTGGQLRWSRTYTGYGEERVPPASATVTVDEASLGRLIDLCRAGSLNQDITEQGGALSGPGSLLSYRATITLDGKTGRTRLEVPRPWNGPTVEPSARQSALDDLRLQLSVLAQPPK